MKRSEKSEQIGFKMTDFLQKIQLINKFIDFQSFKSLNVPNYFCFSCCKQIIIITFNYMLDEMKFYNFFSIYSLMRCHLQTQLSSGLITAIRPSKLLLVQSYTLSLLFFIRRNSSQLSQPSVSN